MSNDELVRQLKTASIQADDMRLKNFGFLMKTASDTIEELQKQCKNWEDTACDWRDAYHHWLDNYMKDVPKWIPVSEKLPEANVDVLALYEWTGQFHKEERYTYICRASYIPKNTIRVDDKWAEVDEEWMDYWEETE